MHPELQFTIDPHHPSIAGHFPGRPIVPGVVVLDQIMALILRDRPEQYVATLHEVKFLGPIVPGDTVAIEIVESTPEHMTFVGRAEQRVIVRGRAGFDVAE
jgi:3-hydroxymyristoyl/3-hydroxydecanoyl-(acyl carrier protein) dehydratase